MGVRRRAGIEIEIGGYVEIVNFDFRASIV